MATRPKIVGLIAVLGLLVLGSAITVDAGSGGGTLGIAAPLQELHTEGWDTVIPVAIALIGGVMILAGLVLHHGGLFMAIASVLVVIGAIGVGIPTVMQNSGLAFGATPAEVAVMVDVMGGFLP